MVVSPLMVSPMTAALNPAKRHAAAKGGGARGAEHWTQGRADHAGEEEQAEHAALHPEVQPEVVDRALRGVGEEPVGTVLGIDGRAEDVGGRAPVPARPDAEHRMVADDRQRIANEEGPQVVPLADGVESAEG